MDLAFTAVGALIHDHEVGTPAAKPTAADFCDSDPTVMVVGTKNSLFNN